MTQKQHSIINKKTFWLLFAAIVAAGFYIQINMFPNDNVTWLMHGTNILLHGGNYNQFFEITPPSTLLIYLIPTLLSHILTGHLSLIIYTFSLIFFSTLLSRNLIYLRQDELSKNSIDLLIIFAVALIIFYPSINFGEREHIATILIIPYLLLANIRASNTTLSNRSIVILVGLMAGIGFTIKPYFLLCPLFIELYLALKKRTLLYFIRYETIMITLYAIFYVAIIWFFYPEYLNKVLPFALNLYTISTRETRWAFILQWPVFIFYVAFLISIPFFFSKKKHLIPLLSIAGCSFFLINLFQGSSVNNYRFIPSAILSLILMTLIVLQLNNNKKSQQRKRLKKCYAFAITILIFFVFIFVFLSTLIQTNFFLKANVVPSRKQLRKITATLITKSEKRMIWQTMGATNPLNNFMNTLPATTRAINATRFFTKWPMYLYLIKKSLP